MLRTNLFVVAIALVSVGCSGDEDPASSDTAPGLTTTTDSDTSTGDTSTTGVPTTGDPATSTTSTSTTDEPTGTTGPICEPGEANCVCDAGECAEGLTCVDDLCVPAEGDVCEDEIGEPDDTELDAQDLGETDDDDDKTLKAAGVLSGAGDVDWFTYHALDTFLHVAEPTVKVSSSAAVRVCQFLECDEGGVVKTEVTCPAGTQSDLSGALRPGCCGGATFTISDFNCPGSSDDIRVFVRLDMPSEDECVEYSLTVHN